DVRHVSRGEPLGAAPAAAIRDDEPCPGGEAEQEAGEVRALPVHVDVRAVALEVDEIGGTLPADLVGERYVTIPGEPGLRAIHAPMVLRRSPCRKGPKSLKRPSTCARSSRNPVYRLGSRTG